jgi:hypothetical protein
MQSASETFYNVFKIQSWPVCNTGDTAMLKSCSYILPLLNVILHVHILVYKIKTFSDILIYTGPHFPILFITPVTFYPFHYTFLVPMLILVLVCLRST